MDFLEGRRAPDLYHTYLSSLFETWSDVLVQVTPPSGQVLDIACGTGIVSKKLAQHPGTTHVDAIDVAAAMIEKAIAVTDPEIPVDYHVASADELPFAENQFTAAYCQQGLQFFPDKTRALKEAARVIEPGGTVTLAVWTAANDGNPVFGAFEEIVARELGEDLLPFGPFSFGDRQALEQSVRLAGLKLLSLDRIERVAPLSDPRTLVLFDLLFLGRPGPDGHLEPLFDPSDASRDAQIEAMISSLHTATKAYQEGDGSLRALTTANILVAEVTW